VKADLCHGNMCLEYIFNLIPVLNLFPHSLGFNDIGRLMMVTDVLWKSSNINLHLQNFLQNIFSVSHHLEQQTMYV